MTTGQAFRRTEPDPDTQRAALKRELEAHAGNVSETAKALGFARSHVDQLLTRYDLRKYARSLRPGNGRGRPPRRA
jgi:transcriptional regulator of acetoin/glycerol metabolism